MKINDLTHTVIGICIKIHDKIGPGLFESVYEEVLCYELSKAGISFTKQEPINVYYDGMKMDVGFIADVIVEKRLILELKSVEKLMPVHYKQLQTYLKLTHIQVGLLINFNTHYLKEGITRIVNNYVEE